MMSTITLLLAVSAAAYTLTDTCPVCCNIGQAPTNFVATNPLSQRCDAPKNKFVGCCNEIGHCCPGILGFPSKKYLCCDTAKRETCKNSYEPVCYIAQRKETASQLYCTSIRQNGRPGTCWRRCGLTAQGCAAPVVQAPVFAAAPMYNPAPTYAATSFASTGLYGNGFLRQFTTSPLSSLSYGLNFPQVSQTPYLATSVRAAPFPYSQAVPLYSRPAPILYSAPAYIAPAPVCDQSTACSCDDACVVRGDCCFDYCAFCVTKP
jgi:hypothetical protein